MKNRYQIVVKTSILLVSLTSIFSCSDPSEEQIVQLIRNSQVELGDQSPDSWRIWQGSYSGEWTDVEAYSGDKSLKITSNVLNTDFAYWLQTIGKDSIPYGRKLRLGCMIKLDEVDVNSEGVSFVVRGDDKDYNNVYFHTTQNNQIIRGDKDLQKYTLETKTAIPEEVEYLHVFLVLLDNTVGTVYFDDITLKPID